jgi:hypothetical protein
MIAFLLLLQPAHAAAVAVHGCDCLHKAVMPRCASAAFAPAPVRHQHS